MQDRLPLGQSPSLQVSPAFGRSVLAGLAVGLAALLAIYLGLGVLFVQALPAPAFTLDLSTESGLMETDALVGLRTTGWGTTVREVRLTEFDLDDDGAV